MEHRESLRNVRESPSLVLNADHCSESECASQALLGEAYVAGKWGYDDAWYSSYKWLTSRIWTNGKCPTDEWHQKFKAALHANFPRLADLQGRALALTAELGFKPVAPDLWLIRQDEHWFVEAKIPPDHLAESQLAGFALIATCLPTTSTKPVRVATVYLQEESAGDRQIPADIQQKFEAYCARLRRSPKRLYRPGTVS